MVRQAHHDIAQPDIRLTQIKYSQILMMERLNKISYDIIGCSYKVHSALGPGLLESAYGICLAHELSKINYKFEPEKSLPVCHYGIQLEACYRIEIS